MELMLPLLSRAYKTARDEKYNVILYRILSNESFSASFNLALIL
jgi:hypothetical protein